MYWLRYLALSFLFIPSINVMSYSDTLSDSLRACLPKKNSPKNTKKGASDSQQSQPRADTTQTSSTRAPMQKSPESITAEAKIHALVARFLNPQDTLSWNAFCTDLAVLFSQHEQFKEIAPQLSQYMVQDGADQQTIFRILGLLSQLRAITLPVLPPHTQELLNTHKDDLFFYYQLVTRRLQLSTRASATRGCRTCRQN